MAPAGTLTVAGGASRQAGGPGADGGGGVCSDRVRY